MYYFMDLVDDVIYCADSTGRFRQLVGGKWTACAAPHAYIPLYYVPLP